MASKWAIDYVREEAMEHLGCGDCSMRSAYLNDQSAVSVDKCNIHNGYFYCPVFGVTLGWFVKFNNAFRYTYLTESGDE